MLKAGKFATLAILGALAIDPAFAEDKSVAMVNGVSIPQSRIDLSVKAATAQGQEDNPELRKAIREDMIDLEVIAQEAVKLGLNKDADVADQVELAMQQVLAGAFVLDYAKSHPIGDEQLQQEYERMKSQLGSKEYHVRHILMETEAEAKNIIAQLGKGTKFEKLAEKSRDAGSAQLGGELGWAAPGNFAPEFANALLKLNKGEHTMQPVQSQFGWHVIKLEDIRDLEVPPLEQVKPQLQQYLQQHAIQQAIDELRTKARIE